MRFHLSLHPSKFMTRTRLLVAVMALCLASAVHAQTDSTRIEQNVGYTTEALYAAYPDSMVRPDTTLGSFQRYDPLYHSGSFYGHLGQVGSPVYNLMFRPYNGVTFLLREDPYAPYLFTADRVRYHRLVSPYTDLFYVQGSKQEQVLEVVHSQQVMPTLNMAVRFRRINVPGFYSRQQAGHLILRFQHMVPRPVGQILRFRSSGDQQGGAS